MAKLQLVQGTTSKTVRVFIQNNLLMTGAGLTGLVFNTSGLTAYYFIEGAGSSVQISLATATLGTWSTGGFIVVDGTNMPGMYELGIPNLALASGKSVTIYLQGAANMAPCVLEIETTATNNQDGIHGGMTAIPNTACTTNASLITSGASTDQLSVASGRVDLGKILGTAVSTPATAGILDVNIKNIVNVAAALDGNNRLKVDADDLGGQAVTAASGVTFPASVASPTNITAGTITTTTNLTNAPTAGDLTSTMKTSVQTASAAAITAANLPTLPQISSQLTDASGTVWFISPNGNDSNAGTTPAKALATWNTLSGSLVDGDAIHLGAGTYPTLDELSFGTDLEIIGDGMFATTIINPNFLTTGQIIGSTGSGGAHYFKVSHLNAGSAVVTTGIPAIYLNHVYAVGHIDGLAIFDEALVSSVCAEDCIFGSSFDSCNIVGVLNSVFRRCTFLSIGDGSNIARGVINQSTLSDPGGPMLLVDCDITATNTNNNCAGVVVSGATGVAPITLVNCRINVSHSGTGTVHSLDAGASGTITCYGCTFDRSITNGTIVDLPLSALPVELTAFAALASLVSTVGAAGAGLTAVAPIVWKDTTAGDFTVSGSIGKSLGGAFTALGTSVYSTAALANAPSGGGGGGGFTIAELLATAIPFSNTADTVADCFNAARVGAYGNSAIIGSQQLLYQSDGSTVAHTFNLDNTAQPSSRTT